MENKQILLNDTTIHYTKTGKGKPVMLVHGFGENRDIWDGQVNVLKESTTLIIPELPGSGDSDLIEDMSIEGMALALKKILDNENIQSCTMIGHSMGGYITLAFAEKFGSLLNAFGLFHSTAYADSIQKIETRKKGIAFIKEHGPFEFLKATTPNLFSPGFRETHPESVDQQISRLGNFSAPALVSYYEAMMNRPDRVNVLKTSEIPILFIAGEYDNAVPLKDVLEQCSLPQLSYIHILRQSGHMGMLEEAEKSNRILIDFLLK